MCAAETEIAHKAHERQMKKGVKYEEIIHIRISNGRTSG